MLKLEEPPWNFVDLRRCPQCNARLKFKFIPKPENQFWDAYYEKCTNPECSYIRTMVTDFRNMA